MREPLKFIMPGLHTFTIDRGDYARICKFVKKMSPYSDPSKWQAGFNTTGKKRLYYATKTIGGSRGKKWKLHRLIFHLRGINIDGKEIDHRDGNTLNNCFNNLRIATSGQNKINRATRQDSKTQIKGVEYRAKTDRWIAYIRESGKKRHLGVFPTANEAALAYNIAAIEIWGKYAWTNKVKRSKLQG